jgi:polysaccharide deacetylase family protein (PEP-CTERM system associated)
VRSILSVDVEDWFHILDVDATPAVDTWAALDGRVERTFQALLDTFSRHDQQVTCFFLGWVGERYPGLVREAVARGHEIASHGHHHQLVYGQTRAAFGEDLRRAKGVLEDLAGMAVNGYRAPGFSVTTATPWALDEIAAAGHTYDSSVFPASRGHGGLAGAPIHPHRVATPSGELLEFPVSVAPMLGKRICLFGGGYLRLFPWPVIERMARRVVADGRPVVYYLHPREIDPGQPRLPMSRVRRFKTYVNLSTTAGKLERLLEGGGLTTFRAWIAEHGATLGTVADA